MEEIKEGFMVSKARDEDEYQYIYRICSNKDIIGTWSDVADIINKELGYEYTESKYRKQYQSFQRIFEANQKQLGASDAYIDSITEKTREMNRERVKLQTEKLEYNRWLRENARDELIMEKIADEIRNLPAINSELELFYPECLECQVTKRMLEESGINLEAVLPDGEEPATGILCYGDEHYGTEFRVEGLYGEVINEYNPEIFYDRMNVIMSKTLEKVRQHGFNKLKIYSLGDEIDGILRVSQLSKLRYGVVESTIRYAEFICKWLNKFCSSVKVEFHMAEGNHSELRMLGQPKGTFTQDNMSRVIKQFIKVRMENNPNFIMVENKSGLIFDTVYGLNILGIHGEVKNMCAALKNFNVMYDTNIDILIGGHKHHYAAETIGVNKDVISIPSVVGVDPYSMKISKTSNAGATFLVIEPGYGVTEQYNIKVW